MPQKTPDADPLEQAKDGMSSSAASVQLNDESQKFTFDTAAFIALANQAKSKFKTSATPIVSECGVAVIAQDDFVKTALNVPVTIDVISSGVDFKGTPLEVILLNEPFGATAVVNDDNSVTFTPNEGFLGTSSIHYLIEGSDSSSTEATITIEVQTQFAFDSFTNISVDETFKSGGNDYQDDCFVYFLTQKIFTLVSHPIFCGYAQPSAQIVGRIYDQAGALIGEESVNSDLEGKWMMKMQSAHAHEFYRIEFDHVLNASSDMGGSFSLKPDNRSYQVMKTLPLNNSL